MIKAFTGIITILLLVCAAGATAARLWPAPKAEESGKVESCIACHANGKENDYIMTMPVKYSD